MPRVFVIIPYFQRRAGLLRRAVESIYRQELDDRVAVSVIVIDDASPTPPEDELAGFNRANFSVQILRQPNGGPASARNAGLDAAGGADYVAFLDSDDWWLPTHLSAGLSALARGAEFYFADNQVEDNQTWFDTLGCRDRLIGASEAVTKSVRQMPGADFMRLLLTEYIPHTSTVILDIRRFRDLRFDESLKTAGEDHLFWLSVVARSQRIAFCTELTAVRGRGLDLCRGAYDWSSPDCVRRLYFNLMLQKKARARFCRTKAERRDADGRIGIIRREMMYVLVRNALRFPKQNAWALGKIALNDAGFWLNLPRNSITILRQRFANELDFARPTG